jgi:hypothetical protein
MITFRNSYVLGRKRCVMLRFVAVPYFLNVRVSKHKVPKCRHYIPIYYLLSIKTFPCSCSRRMGIGRIFLLLNLLHLSFNDISNDSHFRQLFLFLRHNVASYSFMFLNVASLNVFSKCKIFKMSSKTLTSQNLNFLC